MSELLLELFSEEIPAMMQADAALGYKNIFANYFREKEISFDKIDTYSGPRRLVIHVTSIQQSMPAATQEVRGPRTSALERAVEGFCQSHGINKEQLTIKNIQNVEYFFYQQNIPTRKTKEILVADIPNLISSYIWAKSMYWGDNKIKWVRPLKNIMCIFDGQILELEYGHLKANDKSYGHRFMSPSPFEVSDFASYKKQLEENFVILDAKQRKDYIQNEAQKIADKMGLTIRQDEELLEEVTGLVEYPQILLGEIEEKFLTMPSEILVSAMKTHQKYFSLFDKEGKFAPYFIFVSNIVSTDPQIVIDGNQKVLRARLSDALYFYTQDLKTTMQARAEKLDRVVFHAKLGSLKEKSERVANIVSFLKPENKELYAAALLCKNDIVSEVVGEFPNLQGIMGYYYAKNEQMSEEFAIAVRDHYKPQGMQDNCPQGSGAILALADKIDSLYGLMLAGEKPTGSKDPYALRRQALGIIHILLDNKLEIDIAKLINFALETYPIQNDSCKNTVLEFLEERLKYFWKDKFASNVINLVLDFKKEQYLWQIESKLKILDEFLKNSDGNNLLEIYKRVKNILDQAIRDDKDNKLVDIKNNLPPINFIHSRLSSLSLKAEEEKALRKCLVDLSSEVNKAVEDRDYKKALSELAEIKEPLSQFFDKIMINVEDENVRIQRLQLLACVKVLFNEIADFDKI